MLGTNRNYSTGISYSALGGMTQEQFGTTIPIYNKLFYNSRGQLAEIREGLTPNNTSWQRGAIINFYSPCWGMCGGSNSTTPMPNNNGNLKIQQVFIPQTDASDYEQHYDVSTQFFEYDSLNRLQFTNEASWRQQYSYDRYGNRTIDQGNTFGAGIPNPYFGVDQGTNRLTPAGGYTMNYDGAGNLIYDNYTGQGQRNFDAENRMTAAWSNGQWQSYVYDADGHRVKRIVGGVETWQVYGVGGELIAEYSASGALQKEYGYRNGQLLITATVTSGGWGPPPSFTGPNPLSTGDQIKLENLTELRSAVNQLRQHAGLSAFSFTVDPSPQQYQTTVKAEHIRQLRTALEQARTALGLSTGGYSHQDLYENQSWIYAIDFQELRNQILSAWNSGSGGVDIRWLVSDQLGTPRMIFDQNGSLATTSRHDYLPFGEELFAGTGGRTPQQGYGASDGVRQHFTDKERDNETGLDFFNARYYSSMQGRFTSRDPILISAPKLLDPQQWNMYSYTRNNPVRFTDPTGEYVCTDTKKCEQFEKARQEGLKSKDPEAVRAAKAYGDPSKKQGDKGDNGVYVMFKDNLKGDRAGTVERRDTGMELDPTNANGNGLRATANVTIQSDHAGDEEVIEHEGSHVADRQDFVNAIPADGVDLTKANAFNITLRESEIRAYKLSISYAQRGNVTLNFGPCGMTKECKFPPGMMPALRDQQIDDLLRSQYKNLDTVLFPEFKKQ